MTVDDPLQACLRGDITADTALARMLLAGYDAAAIRRRLDDTRTPGSAWAALDLLAEQQTLKRLRCMLDSADVCHDRAATPAEIAALFDRAVTISPEASVAMYSLGDHARLQAATDEIVEWLQQTDALGPDHNVLDLGCGIGRATAAVAPHVRLVIGTEVSAGMLREARNRCTSPANIVFLRSCGQNLSALADAAFDLVLAIDSFPYLIQAGVAELHMAEISRLLRRGGRLVILNLSYRDDPAADRNDAETWAQRYGFALRQSGALPFHTWDARAYVFERIPMAAAGGSDEAERTATEVT